MTESPPLGLSRRLQTAVDRLGWGFSDLRRILAEFGLWPTVAPILINDQGEFFKATETKLTTLAKASKAQGLLVPAQDCLWGQLQLPAMPRQDLPKALQEALWRVSPLPLDQVCYAWQAQPQTQGGWSLLWGVCRRELQEQRLSQLGLAKTAPLYMAQTTKKALPARNESYPHLTQRQRWTDGLGFLLAGLLIAALLVPAMLPLALKRQDVVNALQHVTRLDPQAGPLRVQLDDLRLQAELTDRLLENAQQTGLPLASALDALTQALPDDSWLDRLDFNGKDIRLSGVANNAGDVITRLSRDSQFTDVRASAASVRDNTLNKERFTFDLRWRGAPSAALTQPPALQGAQP